MTSIAKRFLAPFAASAILSLALIGAANAAASTNYYPPTYYQPPPW
jgi:uncharacterized RDD family membrane protein YckC